MAVEGLCCSICGAPWNYERIHVIYTYQMNVKGVAMGWFPPGPIINGVMYPREWEWMLCDYCFFDLIDGIKFRKDLADTKRGMGLDVCSPGGRS